MSKSVVIQTVDTEGNGFSFGLSFDDAKELKYLSSEPMVVDCRTFSIDESSVEIISEKKDGFRHTYIETRRFFKDLDEAMLDENVIDG